MKQVNFVPPSALDFFPPAVLFGGFVFRAKLVREISFRCAWEVTVMFSVTTWKFPKDRSYFSFRR